MCPLPEGRPIHARPATCKSASIVRRSADRRPQSNAGEANAESSKKIGAEIVRRWLTVVRWHGAKALEKVDAINRLGFLCGNTLRVPAIVWKGGKWDFYGERDMPGEPEIKRKVDDVEIVVKLTPQGPLSSVMQEKTERFRVSKLLESLRLSA